LEKSAVFLPLKGRKKKKKGIYSKVVGGGRENRLIEEGVGGKGTQATRENALNGGEKRRPPSTSKKEKKKENEMYSASCQHIGGRKE